MKKLIVVLAMMFAVVSSNVWADSAVIYNPANGHSYQRIDTVMTWHEAKAHCESLGGYLATITSQAENDFVYGNIGIDGKDIWLGGTDEVVEGTWEWITGEAWDYTNWAPGEPNNVGGVEHYLSFFYAYSSQWNDLRDHVNASFICEWDDLVYDGAISGFVTTTFHMPITDTQLRLYYQGQLVDTAQADEYGYYEFTGLHNGKYTVMAARYDFERSVKAIVVKLHIPWGKDVFVNFELVSTIP